ncbi:uncharacterized protein [Pempheris klunzingeri]|uniref:uncharacterized protein n=1 Tax=Pempheris klunzingeri TaxID=3127111 RepID=UPI0039808D51
MENLNCEDMAAAAAAAAAETDDKKKTFFRKPNSILWTATGLVVTYVVWCVLVIILTASGIFLNSLQFDCVNIKEEESRLKNKATLVYLWAGLSLLACIVQLLEIWRRKGFYGKVFVVTICVLTLVMILSFVKCWNEEAQEIKMFEERYLALLPLTHTPGNTESLTDTICHKRNVYHWQAEFKCCGLKGYQDWKSSIPDSCLCAREDNSSACVEVGNSLVYEKPCLPIVLSLDEKHRSRFWAIMIIWVILVGSFIASAIVGAVIALLVGCCWMIKEEHGYKLSYCIYRMRGGEEMVPVVFITNNNNSQTEEEIRKNGEAKESSRDGSVVLDMEGRINADGEGQEAEEEDRYDNTVTMIPRSLLKRLQEEHGLRPVRYRVRSSLSLVLSPVTRDFYTIMIQEVSPFLPSGAVLVDPNNPNKLCIWVEGPHLFDVSHIVWPRQEKSEGTQALL